MKRRTEITIETERTVFSEGTGNIRQTRWCKDCNAQTKHISLDEASHLLHLNAKHILRLMGADCHHIDERGVGNIFVCLNSLLVEVMLSLATKVTAGKATYVESTT